MKIRTINLRRIPMKIYAKAPTLLTITGIGILGKALYDAYKAGTKVEEVMAEPLERISEVKAQKDILDKKEYGKTLVKAYGHAFAHAGKLFGPFIAEAALGTIFIGKGHGMLLSRYSDALADCAAVEMAYREYQKRSIEKFGEEAHNDILRGNTEIEIDVPDLDKNGNPKKDKEGNIKSHKETVKAQTKDPINYSTAIFDEYSSQYLQHNGSAEDKQICGAYNANYIAGRLDYYNHLLKTRGYVFEHEMRENLGLNITEEGLTNGCFYDPTDDSLMNRIDFGIQKLVGYDENGAPVYEWTDEYLAFERGEIDALWLTFKTDGNISKHLFSSRPKNKSKKLKRVIPGFVEVYA